MLADISLAFMILGVSSADFIDHTSADRPNVGAAGSLR